MGKIMCVTCIIMRIKNKPHVRDADNEKKSCS